MEAFFVGLRAAARRRASTLWPWLWTGAAFGLAAGHFGLGAGETLAMFLLTSHDVGQLTALNMLCLGAPAWALPAGVCLSALSLENAADRAALRLKDSPPAVKMWAAFAVNDVNTRLLARAKKQPGDAAFLAGLEAAEQAARLLGAAAGLFLYALLPTALRGAAGAAMYAFSAAALVDLLTAAASEKQWGGAAAAGVALTCASLMSPLMPPAYAALLAAVLGAGAGTLLPGSKPAYQGARRPPKGEGRSE